jgi:hypothetical protein
MVGHGAGRSVPLESPRGGGMRETRSSLEICDASKKKRGI